MVALAAGYGYVINNRRWLHGRRAFAGPRLLYCVTANAHQGTIQAGFRLAPDEQP
jgi:hypothetical protein